MSLPWAVFSSAGVPDVLRLLRFPPRRRDPPRVRAGPVELGGSLAGVLALALLGIAPPLSAQPAVFQDARDTVLDNGLRVVAAPNSLVPVATVEIAFRGGAQTQIEEADAGVPHILEHMLFKSYEKGGRDWWSERTGEIEAIYNGTTGQEVVTYYLTLPSENFDRGLELLGDLVRRTEFKKEALREETRIIRDELERRSSNPYRTANVVAEMALWGPAYRRKNPIGNLFTILGADPERLEEHYERFYVPNNAAVIVTGDVQPAEVFESAAKHFRRWKKGRNPFADLPPVEPPPLEIDSIFVVEADVSEVRFTVLWQGPGGRDDPQGAVAGEDFAEIVNLPTSAMQRRLVDTGPFASVRVSYRLLQGVGAIKLVARTTRERLAEASEALRVELDRMARDDYLRAEDVRAARKRSRVRLELGAQTSTGLAHALADRWSVGRLGHVSAAETSGSGGDVEDVRRFIASYLTHRPRVVCLVMSGETIRSEMQTLAGAIGRWRRP